MSPAENDMHPDDDLLADLAAGQLRGGQAERVEAHVLACATCSELLAGAEEVRSLLRRQPRPTMPDDVAARLASLVRAGPPAAPATPAPATPAPAGSAEAAPGPDPTAPTRILRPVTGRLTPVGRGSRRQQRTEERTDVRRDRWTSFGRVAAGVVAVAVLGGGAVAGARALRGDGGSGSGGATAASDSGGEAATAVATPVLATGRKYDSSNLKARVAALVADSRRPPAPRAASTPAGTTAGTSGSTADGSTTKASGGQQLRSAPALEGCLKAIGRGGERPVAVDLATYSDREAAMIVLQQPDGSYEVWVVARDCHPGADGTIAVRTVTP